VNRARSLTQALAIKNMTDSDRDFCLKAVAYLKIGESVAGGPSIDLDQANSPVVKSVGEELLATYVVDTGSQFSFVQHRHLEGAAITAEQLHGQSVYNLAVLAQSKLKIQPYGNIYAVLMGGNFEASLILLPSLWSKSLIHLAPNGYVAAFPARDILAFADAANVAGIAELHQLCERIKGTNDHPLTQKLYSHTEGEWRPHG
jgi:uncharacterized protein YtpQ (UPF0354 family)